MRKTPGTQPTPPTPDEPLGFSSGKRTAISLMLIIHFFLVFVAMSANLAPVYSRIQSRILARFALYTQLLVVDLNFTPFYWTHATADDVDHRIEVLAQGKRADVDSDWVTLPDVGWRGSDRYQRYQRLGRVWALLSQQDEMTARLAQAIGASFLEQRHTRPTRVRCRRHMLQSWDVIHGGTSNQRDPNDPTYFQVAYDANLVISRNGTVSVVKLAAAGEIAQPTRTDGKRNASNP